MSDQRTPVTGGIWRVALVMGIAICLDAVGSTLIKVAVGSAGELSGVSWEAALDSGVRVMAHWVFWLGILCLAGFFFLYTASLSWAPVSVVMPFNAGSYVLIILLAYFFLGESVPLMRWVGSAVVGVGIIVVGRTAR